MIVVLGPPELGLAVAEAHPGELVVGARDDERLAAAPLQSAEIAAVLPLPARACVVTVPVGATPAEIVEAVRLADGALTGSRIVVLGEPPDGMPLRAWCSVIERLGAVAVRNVAQLIEELARARAEGTSAAEERAMRPGAPEAAAWREALRAARPGRFAFLRRRARVEGKAAERELDEIVRLRLAPGCHTIAVISPKGGVGKTFLSFLLGSTLARVRGDRILVVDTNPDFGTLADLNAERVPATISDLLADIDQVETDEEIAAYATTTRTGMQILAAPQDPEAMERLGRDGYSAVSDLLAAHYDLVVFDCGTGFLDEITQFALGRADQVVLVSEPRLVTSKIIMGAADHLASVKFDIAKTTLAVNMVRGDEPIDRGRLRTALVGRVGGIVEIPYDERLRLDLDLGEFDYPRILPATRQALKRLAAEVIGRMPGAEVAAAAADGALPHGDDGAPPEDPGGDPPEPAGVDPEEAGGVAVVAGHGQNLPVGEAPSGPSLPAAAARAGEARRDGEGGLRWSRPGGAAT